MSQRLRGIENILGHQSRLKAIRRNSQLDVGEMRNLLMYQGNYEKHVLPFYDFIDSNKHIFTHHNLENQTRQDMRKDAAKMILAILQHFKLDPLRQPSKMIFAFWAIAMYDGGIVTKSMLHYFLYCKSLVMFGNNPKHEQLLADAIALKDFGCFALTEFHHGSYSKEVQTLATYNHQAKEFILTTQGQKGMKYWIGAASQIANMSTIWAQLIIKGKSYGPHPFIVPLRCKKTHRVLPGITIGDCGPKNGLDYIDNGYIMLDNVAIPKDNLLGKLGHIDESGNYVTKIQNSDARFGFHMSPLSGGRGAVAFIANVGALKAATVALRYACNRKQFQNTKKTDQVIIIDYALTKNRLIPEIAQIFVQISPGLDLAKRYFQNPNILSNLQYAAELHAISACTKARISWNCTSTAQTTRTILGGHGYSAFNNFKSFFHDTDINNTWEGDNNMLLQQTSKYLMKAIHSKQKTSILDLSFVWGKFELDQGKIQSNLRSLDSIDLLLKGLFLQKYNNATTTFAELTKSSKDKAQVWLHFHPQAGNSLALSYADYYIYSVARQRISLSKSDKNKQFLLKCLYLWAFCLIQRQRLGSLDLRKSIQKQILLLSDELTEPCVLATDILIPSSHIIGSIFGNFQGNIYDEYLSHIYSAKDTFTRVPYFQEIIEIKQKR